MTVSFRLINSVLDQSSIAAENQNLEETSENSEFRTTLEKCTVIMAKWFQEHFNIVSDTLSNEEVLLVACSVDVIMGPYFSNILNLNPCDLNERIPRFMHLNFGSIDSSDARKEKLSLKKAKMDHRFSGFDLPNARVAELFAHFSLQSDYITCKKWTSNRCVEGTAYLIAVGKYLDSRGDRMSLPDYSSHFRMNTQSLPNLASHDWKKYEVIKSCMGVPTKFPLSRDKHADYMDLLFDYLTVENQVVDLEQIEYINPPRFRKVIERINEFSNFTLEDGVDKDRFFFEGKIEFHEYKSHRFHCARLPTNVREDLWDSLLIHEPLQGENKGKLVVIRKTYQTFPDKPPIRKKMVEVEDMPGIYHRYEAKPNTRYSTGPFPNPRPKTHQSPSNTSYSTGPFPKEPIPQPKRNSPHPNTRYSAGPFPKESIPQPKRNSPHPNTRYSTGPFPKESIPRMSHSKQPSHVPPPSEPQPKERVRPMPNGKSQSPPPSPSKKIPKSSSYPSHQPKRESFARPAAAQPKNPPQPSQRDRVLSFFALNSENLIIFRERIITPSLNLLEAHKSNDAFIALGPEGRKEQAQTMIAGITELAKALRMRNMRALQAAFHVDRLKLQAEDARIPFFEDLFNAISTNLQELVESDDIRDISENPTWSL